MFNKKDTTWIRSVAPSATLAAVLLILIVFFGAISVTGRMNPTLEDDAADLPVQPPDLECLIEVGVFLAGKLPALEGADGVLHGRHATGQTAQTDLALGGLLELVLLGHEEVDVVLETLDQDACIDGVEGVDVEIGNRLGLHVAIVASANDPAQPL